MKKMLVLLVLLITVGCNIHEGKDVNLGITCKDCSMIIENSIITATNWYKLYLVETSSCGKHQYYVITATYECGTVFRFPACLSEIEDECSF